MSATKPIRVLVADDNPLVRIGLQSLLERTGDIQVVGEAVNDLQAVAEARHLVPDVVLLDVSMPELNGIEAARQIRHLVPSSRVLMLSGSANPRQVRNAIDAGASGFLLKEMAAHDLLKAIRSEENRQLFFSPDSLRQFLQEPDKERVD